MLSQFFNTVMLDKYKDKPVYLEIDEHGLIFKCDDKELVLTDMQQEEA